MAGLSCTAEREPCWQRWWFCAVVLGVQELLPVSQPDPPFVQVSSARNSLPNLAQASSPSPTMFERRRLACSHVYLNNPSAGQGVDPWPDCPWGKLVQLRGPSWWNLQVFDVHEWNISTLGTFSSFRYCIVSNSCFLLYLPPLADMLK